MATETPKGEPRHQTQNPSSDRGGKDNRSQREHPVGIEAKILYTTPQGLREIIRRAQQ